jgi:hypothetical protein
MGRRTRELEVLLPAEKRDEVRARVLAKAPRWYNPWVHLALPSTFAIAVIGVALGMLEQPTGWQLLTVPVTYLLTNMNEWYIHRDILHRRFPLAPILYDRHTPEHHVIYVTDDMAIRSWREFHLVLIPAYGLFGIFVTLLPLAALLWFALSPNVACLYTATVMFYAASYEWLHLSYHLPKDHPIGRLRLIERLRTHHAVHHDPRLMQRWNFNVTLPFWDWVMGTTVRDVPAAVSATERAHLA